MDTLPPQIESESQQFAMSGRALRVLLGNADGFRERALDTPSKYVQSMSETRWRDTEMEAGCMSGVPLVITSESELIRHVVAEIVGLKGLIMATKQELEASLTALNDSLQDFTADVTATLADLTAKLDAALAADSADHAALEEMKALTDDVVTRTNAMTDAIKQADTSVDRS